MKTYLNPMLQIVSINKSDVIATSTVGLHTDQSFSNENQFGAADRFRDWE